MMQGRQAHLIVAVDVYGFAHLGVVQVILRTAFGRGGGAKRDVADPSGDGEAAPPPHPGGHPHRKYTRDCQGAPNRHRTQTRI